MNRGDRKGNNYDVADDIEDRLRYSQVDDAGAGAWL